MGGDVESDNAMWLPPFLLSSPYIAILSTCAFLILLTRIITGYLNYQKECDAERSKKIPIIPYWLPYIGHAFDLLRSPDDLATRGRYAILLIT